MIWEMGARSWAQKKAVLRCLIDKVVLHRPSPDRVHTCIVWRGGDTTTFDIPVPVGSFDRLASAQELEQQVVALHAAGASDAAIAQALTGQGYRSPRRESVLVRTVCRIRLKQRLLRERTASRPARPAGSLLVAEVAERLRVTQHWL
jgi:hypothetical protein